MANKSRDIEIKKTALSPRVTSKQFWHKHYLAFLGSNLSKMAYTKQHKLTYYNFIYWCHKFENKKNEKKFATSFLPIQIESHSLKNANAIGILELGNNKRLLIHDLSVLKTLLGWDF